MKLCSTNNKFGYMLNKLILIAVFLFSTLFIVSTFSILGVSIVGAQDTNQQAVNLWKQIQTDKYQDNWSLFPGKGKLYKGTVPHGMLLTTYVNKTSKQGLTSGAKELSKGSILIKENYMPDNKLAAITVMEKTGDGKDDWYWVKYNPEGTIATMEMEKDGMKMEMPVAGGKETMCATCHTASVSGVHNIMTPINK